MTTKPLVFNRRCHNIEVLPVDEAKLQELITEHGHEQAIGYLKALQDIHDAFELTLGHLGSTKPSLLAKKLELFVEHHNEILDICKTLLSGHPANKSPNPDL